MYSQQQYDCIASFEVWQLGIWLQTDTGGNYLINTNMSVMPQEMIQHQSGMELLCWCTSEVHTPLNNCTMELFK